MYAPKLLNITLMRVLVVGVFCSAYLHVTLRALGNMAA